MRSKVSQWRWFAAFALTAFALFAAMWACTPRVDVPEIESGYTRITIQNNRVSDAIDPTFYLTGTGRHSLGIVRGMGGKVTKLIDTRWFGPGGCMTISAHYAGYGDLTFERFCWFPGQVIDVSLEELFNPISAWAHR